MRSDGIWRLGLSAGIVIAALFVIAFLVRPSDTAGPCVVVRRTTLPDVPEASGLAISRRNHGVLWTHNDSGNEPDLFALDSSGMEQRRVRLPIRTRDWEALSAAPCAEGNCLY